MHSSVKRSSFMYKTLSKLRTHIVIHEYFLLYFISKIVARLEEEEAPCFMKNASASGSSKSKMLPSLLPLPPASFFNVLPLPQKFNRFHHFRFHIPGSIQTKVVVSKDITN